MNMRKILFVAVIMASLPSFALGAGKEIDLSGLEIVAPQPQGENVNTFGTEGKNAGIRGGKAAVPGGAGNSFGTATITTTNTVAGDITASGKGEVAIGNIEIGPEKDDELKISLSEENKSNIVIPNQSIFFSKDEKKGEENEKGLEYIEECSNFLLLTDRQKVFCWRKIQEDCKKEQKPRLSGKKKDDCQHIFKEKCGDFSIISKEDKERCLENCHDMLGCAEIDGCTVVPDEGFSPWSILFGKEEACCQEPINLPCNNHDRCYQRCGSVKFNCDFMLYIEMSGVCAEAHSSVFKSPLAATCMAQSYMYFRGVRKLGFYAYFERQKENCSPMGLLKTIGLRVKSVFF